MNQVLSWFTRSLFALATIVGLYLAAIAIKAVVYFWLVVGVSAIVGLIAFVVPKLRYGVKAWKEYPSAIADAAAAQAEVDELQHSERTLRAQIAQARADGVSKGRASALGEVLASLAPAPVIAEIAEFEGAVALVVRFDEIAPPVGARYRLVVRTTGQLRGIVEVAEADTTAGIAYLRCIEATSEMFWTALSTNVLTDSSPPTGVLLERPFSTISGAVSSPSNNITEPPDQEIEA